VSSYDRKAERIERFHKKNKAKDKKLFIYVTEYKTRIIAWNITDLTINGYNFN
jgi:hypothetical protein